MFSKLIQKTIKFFKNKMSTPPIDPLTPPACVAGMQKLNRELFEKEVEVPVIILKNTKNGPNKVSKLLSCINHQLLKMPKFKSVQNCGDNIEFYLKSPLLDDLDNVPDLEYEMRSQKITIKYHNYPLSKIIEAILPKEDEGFSSFTAVGHIVHLNLREHLLPYKKILSEILLDKLPNCRTVVNKVQNIDNTYRNFKMELLAGEDLMITRLKENGCTFELDFSKVYWNSRLSTEHVRIVKRINSVDAVFDVFAGIGPFAVPAAKKKCEVFANDLNPDSYKWLRHNFIINNVKPGTYEAYNLDGADFIKTVIQKKLPQFLKLDQQVYIIMNLPALAVDFLPHFQGLLKGEDIGDFKNPIVIVYCFAKGKDCYKIAEDLVSEKLWGIRPQIIEVFKVRTVSNFKEMMRVAFYLNKSILFETRTKRVYLDDDNCQITKKCTGRLHFFYEIKF